MQRLMDSDRRGAEAGGAWGVDADPGCAPTVFDPVRL